MTKAPSHRARPHATCPQVLDGRWNTCGLGYTTPHLSPAELAAARILHWTGSRKPWLKEGHFKEEWEPYSLPPAGQESR